MNSYYEKNHLTSITFERTKNISMNNSCGFQDDNRNFPHLFSIITKCNESKINNSFQK